VAGVLIVALGLLGVGARLMRWLPFPIVMACSREASSATSPAFFEQLDLHPGVVGAAIAGYLGARALGRSWLPPVAGAVFLGLAGAGFAGQVNPEAMRWSASHVEPVAPVLGSGGEACSRSRFRWS
jgi:predicted benzoate:H+ symporter BenE